MHECTCRICGKVFYANNKRQIICSKECKKVANAEWHKRYAERHPERLKEQQRLKRKRQRDKNRKPNTIVADGYAQRQIANSLKIAGRVNTELKERTKQLNDINYMTKLIHENAVEHGWWENERELPEIIALCHSELSEALEAYRNNEPMVWDNNGKPDGVAVEMADCVIRIFDWFGAVGIEPFEVIFKKHKYNKTRPYKHGGKKI